jgi:hypothetical protein
LKNTLHEVMHIDIDWLDRSCFGGRGMSAELGGQPSGQK